MQFSENIRCVFIHSCDRFVAFSLYLNPSESTLVSVIHPSVTGNNRISIKYLRLSAQCVYVLMCESLEGGSGR